MSGMVNNVEGQNIVNRLSPLQRDILAILTERKALPCGDYIGHLPRTGQIIDALERDRNAASYASISRALSRLEKAGLVCAYRGMFSRGKGYAYGLVESAHG